MWRALCLIVMLVGITDTASAQSSEHTARHHQRDVLGFAHRSASLTDRPPRPSPTSPTTRPTRPALLKPRSTLHPHHTAPSTKGT
jgi:hypothetical protein